MTTKRFVTLLDGTPGVVRPIEPTDRNALAEGFDALSPESRVRRFFFNKKKLSEDELAKLTNPDGLNHIAYGLAVRLGDGRAEIPIAVARCFRDGQENDLAEIAVVTRDEWQSNGAGIELMRSLSDHAMRVGIRRWFAAMFANNTAMVRLLDRFGKLRDERDLGNGVIETIYEIVPPPGGFLE
jgi:RimJ/RimL family protein N-acetyltransferase